MAEEFGAISRSHPSGHAAYGVDGASRIDRGYEAYRPALIAFCERDCLTQKAENLRRGCPLDYLDMRMIDALRAAFEEIAA